jgi:hypothetical protein
VTDSDWFWPLTIEAQPVNIAQAAIAAPMAVVRIKWFSLVNVA